VSVTNGNVPASTRSPATGTGRATARGSKFPKAPLFNAAAAPVALGAGTIGQLLRRQREARSMSVAEVSRVTRIPHGTLASIESDHFDDLPGEVFVRGFLKAYSQAIGLDPEEILARYTSSRRAVYVTPLPVASPVQSMRGRTGEANGRRFGVAIAFVLLLILFTLALSIVLKPRGHDMPHELSLYLQPTPTAPVSTLGSSLSAARV
jgi:transcriptional regulator with XRE-family HTH domain